MGVNRTPTARQLSLSEVSQKRVFAGLTRKQETYHTWTLREGMRSYGPIAIALPRNAFTAGLWAGDKTLFKHVAILPRQALPLSILAACSGRLGRDLIDHWIFGAGMPGHEAKIVSAKREDIDGTSILVFVFDRPMHPSKEAVSAHLVLEAPPAEARLFLSCFRNNGLVEPWESDADETPLDQHDQSWRDLTDEQIEEIRHA